MKKISLIAPILTIVIYLSTPLLPHFIILVIKYPLKNFYGPIGELRS